MILYIFIINGIILREILQTISRNLWKNIPGFFCLPRCLASSDLHPWSWWKPLQWTLLGLDEFFSTFSRPNARYTFSNHVPPILVWNWFNFDAYLSHGWLMQPSSSGGFKGAQEGEPLRWPGIPMPSPIASPRTEAPETTTLTVGAGRDFVGGCGLVARLVQLVMVLTNNLRLMNILQNLQWTLQVVHEFWPSNCIKGNDEFSFGMSNRTYALFVLCIPYSLSLHTP